MAQEIAQLRMDIVAQEVARLKMDIRLHTKKFASMNSKNMKAVGLWGKNVRHDEFNSEEVAIYFDIEMASFQGKV